jgi:superfamily II DNA/RNA helicase
LADLLRNGGVRSAIVFCNRKTTVRELATSLKRGHLKVGQIHGDMEQPERLRELDRFKGGDINILVASDVAARGLDIKDVSHVFNFDVPWQPDDYIHRIGRTGRAGATGVAITLATPADADQLSAIEKMIGAPITPLHGDAEPSGSEAPARERPAERPRKESRAKAEARPKREPQERPTRPVEAREEPRQERTQEPDDLDDNWNGPVPSFLGFGLPN